jgi:O-antigen/teichoic acid export membrane protein
MTIYQDEPLKVPDPDAASPIEEPLAYRAVRGGLWVAFGSYFTFVFGFLANLGLTRLLSPEHFGVFALASFFFGLINLRSKIGINYAFIQRQETTGELIGSHFLLDVLAGLLTLLIATIAVPILRTLGYAQGVGWVLLALAGVGLSDALSTTAWLVLEKALRLRQTSILSSTIFALSYIPAFAVALRGGGYWSLVAQNVAVSVPSLLVMWWVARWQLPALWQIRWRFDWGLSKRLLRFGVIAGLSGLFAAMAMSFDNFLVGTLVGVAALGFYDRAYRIAEWPNKLVYGVVTRTALYTYARLKDDQARLQKTATMLVWLIVTVTIPLGLAVLVSAPEVIRILYGERWQPSAGILRWLIVYTLVRPLLDNANSLFIAVGRPRRATIVAAVQVVALVIAATPLTFLYKTLGTCVGVGAAFIIALMLAWWYMRRTVGIPTREILTGPVPAAALALVAYVILESYVSLRDLNIVIQAALKAGLVVAVFFAGLLALQARLFLERSRYVWQLLRGRETSQLAADP